MHGLHSEVFPGGRAILAAYLYYWAHRLSPLTPHNVPSHRSLLPCPPNDHVGKYIKSKLYSGFHPDAELTCPRQMSQLNHGDALWFVALFPVYPT